MKEADLVAKISSELDKCLEEHGDYPALKKKNILSLVLSILSALITGLFLLSLVVAGVFLLCYGIYTQLGWTGVKGIVICLLVGGIPARKWIGAWFEKMWTMMGRSFKSVRKLTSDYFVNKYVDKYERHLLLSHTKEEVAVFRKKYRRKLLLDDDIAEKIEDLFGWRYD
ncbi:MAG TPA: hypothetical protein DIW30_04895 [Bacteroidales bacterium]|nr:hypothetical protein [Bacteroidales bacterium]